MPNSRKYLSLALGAVIWSYNMHSINIALWLVIFSLVEFSMGIMNTTDNNNTWASAFKNKFPELLHVPESYTYTPSPALGGQDFTKCCKLAMRHFLNNRSSVEIQAPSPNPNQKRC